ncbi:hypothetical protein YC2023_068912 [Brassica napus]
MGRPHVMVIPYPAQGHVLPLMSFSRYLASQGIQVTFVNTEFNHNRIINSLSKSSRDDHVVDGIKLVSIPDGLDDSPEERNVPGMLSESVLHFMPTKVEELIERMISETSGAVISCVVADQSLGWAMEVAAKFGIRRAAFCPAAAASMVLGFSIQKLVDDGLIDYDGTPNVNKTIQLSPGMPEMETDKLVWAAAFEQSPKILPIGPIGLAHHSLEEGSMSLGSFLPEDRDCLDWLDRQIPGSVIYIAFGSYGVMGKVQLEELAIGIELTKRPVLWVTSGGDQPPMRVGSGQVIVVKWAPQHQFINKTYICNVWKIGLGFEQDERRIISRLEVKRKIDEIMRDNGEFKKRAIKIKEIVMKNVVKDGISYENLNKFVNWIKTEVN